MSKNWREIPVLGRLIRIGSAFLKAPERFDALFEENEMLKRSLAEAHRKTDENSMRVEKWKQETEIQTNQIEARTNQIETRANQFETRTNQLESRANHAEKWLEEIYHAKKEYRDRFITNLNGDTETMINLNTFLSTKPTVWGDPAKLHIADSAAVFTCLFNTNSGNITVGEYTFAGSRVSLLAGSHDKDLRGFLRRDAEMTEGCDIVIGNGVWLGSGCTILGPCRIGDNAVIAAGAVVVPGTTVPPDSIFGGVPARLISTLEDSGEQDEKNPHVISAMERAGHILFVQGWTEKKEHKTGAPVGHYLTEQEGLILTDRSRWNCYYGVAHKGNYHLTLKGVKEEIQIDLPEEEGYLEISLPIESSKPEMLRVVSDCPAGELFLAVSNNWGSLT